MSPQLLEQTTTLLVKPEAFPLPDWNMHCLGFGLQFEHDDLIVVRPYIDYNGQPWGSSCMKDLTGFTYTATESGVAVCLFNDEDDNNSGQMFGLVKVYGRVALKGK